MTELEYKGFTCRIHTDEGKFKTLIKGMVDGEPHETPEDTLNVGSMKDAVRMVEPLFHAVVERALR